MKLRRLQREGVVLVVGIRGDRCMASRKEKVSIMRAELTFGVVAAVALGARRVEVTGRDGREGIPPSPLE